MEILDHIHKRKMLAAGILPISSSTGRVLLARRGSDVVHPNTWAAWGGKVDVEAGDIDFMDCAIREFHEESRIEEPYTLVNDFIHVYEDDEVLFITYLGVFEFEPVPNIEVEGEAKDYGWFDIDALPESLMGEFFHMLQERIHDIKKIISEFDI
jgi:8-oxo-dGTP pyrophosphatase MutT (NUDIX family)